jgi:hypothetical protein
MQAELSVLNSEIMNRSRIAIMFLFSWLMLCIICRKLSLARPKRNPDLYEMVFSKSEPVDPVLRGSFSDSLKNAKP